MCHCTIAVRHPAPCRGEVGLGAPVHDRQLLDDGRGQLEPRPRRLDAGAGPRPACTPPPPSPQPPPHGIL